VIRFGVDQVGLIGKRERKKKSGEITSDPIQDPHRNNRTEEGEKLKDQSNPRDPYSKKKKEESFRGTPNDLQSQMVQYNR